MTAYSSLTNLGEAVSKQWSPPSHFDRFAIFEAPKGPRRGGEEIKNDVVPPNHVDISP
jgi:hypothetical protein